MSGANATGVKVSACVDCATPIIGERLRCPACHDAHASQLAAADPAVVGDEDVTVPRSRQRRSTPVRDAMVAWLGACLIVTVMAVVLVIAGRSCQ